MKGFIIKIIIMQVREGYGKMLECSSLFESSKKYQKKYPKQYPKLEKRGIVKIEFNGKFDSIQINKIISDIQFIIKVYKRGCKKIVFICNGIFEPKDMFAYVLFEIFIYTLRCKYDYEIAISIEQAKSNIRAPGLKDSLLIYFNNDKFDKALMEKNYKMIHNSNHFRRIISKEDIKGASILLGDLKLFLSLFDIDKEYSLCLAKVGAELVDNANEHAEADCLIDIYVSDPIKNKKCNEMFYSINMVVINFLNKHLGYDIQKKIEEKNYNESQRYDLVSRAYKHHKKYFDKNSYEVDDFYNLASFQDRISGREKETKTGGTGLTDLIKSLEDRAEAHSCYVLSGNKGLWFEPQYLKYNDDDWIGFNEENDFITNIPNKDIIVRSSVDFLGTGYNFTLIVKKEENKNA